MTRNGGDQKVEKKRTCLVIGMARSGVAAARLMQEAGWRVILSDSKPEAALEAAVLPLRGRENIDWRLGEPAETLLAGVDLLLLSPGVPLTNPAVSLAKERGVETIGELEAAYRAAKGRLIAITGTNGKTTTTTLTGEIFKNAGKLTYVVGNIGFPYAAIADKTRDEDVTVCEVSSFQLETIQSFRPAVAALLNITEDHLNRHGTMENYVAEKAKIFMNQAGDDATVLNYDDPTLRGFRPPADTLWFSRLDTPPEGAFVRDGKIVYGDAAAFRTVCEAAELSIPGPHNLENALAATAIAMRLEVPVPVIRHTLRSFKGVEHRLEFVRELSGVRYVNDSKGTNVDSTIKAIQTMARPTVILLGGSDKHVDMLPLAREIVGSNIRYAVLIGDTADQIAEALDKAGFSAYEKAGYDFEKAIARARDRSLPGGNVLLSPACASFDMFEDYEQRGREFKRIVSAMADNRA